MMAQRQTRQPQINVKRETAARHEDPLSGETGAHPIGVGLGAAATGAAVGAVGGMVGGPVGATLGAIVGAVAGGLGGKAFAEEVDPTIEEAFWRKNYQGRPYVLEGEKYERYAPAYRYGIEQFSAHDGLSFEDIEPKLKRGWEASKSSQNLNWPEARDAVRDVWSRLESDNVD
ncbi:hypothetical protein SH668x_000358 [Planctomicrobium sp. SH668]|uniref:hypothetical protein n=1 Tax=Planctomicrobium sp. SH668 TaxID=3448126 RepID=UPI003F5AEF8E